MKALEELNELEKKAFEMAVKVLKDPSIRPELEKEAEQMLASLDKLAEAIDSEDPELVGDLPEKISEATLDLLFVQADTGIKSVRLSNYTS